MAKVCYVTVWFASEEVCKSLGKNILNITISYSLTPYSFGVTILQKEEKSHAQRHVHLLKEEATLVLTGDNLRLHNGILLIFWSN